MPGRALFGSFVIAGIIAVSGPLVFGQPATNALPAGMTTYETVKLEDGIYGFIPPEDNTAFVSGNSVAIIGDDGVLVVDSGHTPSATVRIISEIKRMTDKPVRFLVNTH